LKLRHQTLHSNSALFFTNEHSISPMFFANKKVDLSVRPR
jgi:hypothetical protein